MTGGSESDTRITTSTERCSIAIKQRLDVLTVIQKLYKRSSFQSFLFSYNAHAENFDDTLRVCYGNNVHETETMMKSKLISINNYFLGDLVQFSFTEPQYHS